jgi:hypothetical protein
MSVEARLALAVAGLFSPGKYITPDDTRHVSDELFDGRVGKTQAPPLGGAFFYLQKIRNNAVRL